MGLDLESGDVVFVVVIYARTGHRHPLATFAGTFLGLRRSVSSAISLSRHCSHEPEYATLTRPSPLSQSVPHTLGAQC